MLQTCGFLFPSFNATRLSEKEKRGEPFVHWIIAKFQEKKFCIIIIPFPFTISFYCFLVLANNATVYQKILQGLWVLCICLPAPMVYKIYIHYKRNRSFSYLIIIIISCGSWGKGIWFFSNFNCCIAMTLKYIVLSKQLLLSILKMVFNFIISTSVMTMTMKTKPLAKLLVRRWSWQWWLWCVSQRRNNIFVVLLPISATTKKGKWVVVCNDVIFYMKRRKLVWIFSLVSRPQTTSISSIIFHHHHKQDIKRASCNIKHPVSFSTNHQCLCSNMSCWFLSMYL